MNIQKLSTLYNVRILNNDDALAVYDLCKQNTAYYKHCPPFVTIESIRKDMTALPPRKSIEDKFYIGYFDNDKLIAVLDLILNFPNESTAFVGFFMLDISIQHKGIGTGIVDELCAYLHDLGYAHIRLGWVDGNQRSEHFWHKNGFIETGAVSKTEYYSIIYAQKEI